jgi:hypothetical protein
MVFFPDTLGPVTINSVGCSCPFSLLVGKEKTTEEFDFIVDFSSIRGVFESNIAGDDMVDECGNFLLLSPEIIRYQKL